MKFLLTLVVISLALIGVVLGQECDDDRVGDSICDKFSFYNGNQYATCVPASYILEQTDNLFQCENTNAQYCWHKCMVELFGVASGNVTEECQCTPQTPNNSSSTTTKSPSTKPPKKCYQPSSNDCSFYLDCLKSTGPNCTSYTNSLQYATIFCEIYNQNFTDYSLNGKSWLRAVEKCFQVSMKPLMSASNKKKCKEQKKDQKKKKASCYLNPGKKEPSLCELACEDYYRVFWSLKNESDVFTVAEDLSDFLRLFKGCKDLSKRCSNDSYVPTCNYKLKFKGKKSLDLYRAKPSPTDEDRDLDTVAAEVADSVWRQLRLNSNQHDIFAYVEDPDKPTSANELQVTVTILSKADFNSNPATWASSPVLKKVNEDFANAIRHGWISLTADVNNQPIGLASAEPCMDDLCAKTAAPIGYNTAPLPIPPGWNAAPSLNALNKLYLLAVTFLLSAFLAI